MSDDRSSITVPGHATPRKVALRLFDWSSWCRQVVQGVQAYAHEAGDWQLFVDVGPAGSGRVLEHAKAWDGIISSVLTNIRAYQKLLQSGSPPVVTLTAFIPSKLREIPSVRVNDLKVAAAVCQHLRRGGFRRLAYVGVMSRQVLDYRADAMRVASDAIQTPCTFLEDETASRKAELKKWLLAQDRPLGIVAWNMDAARRVIDACLGLKIAVPEEMAIIAWDDDPLMAETLEPTISAAVLPAERLGFESAKLLGKLMAGQPRPQEPVLIQPTGMLRVRQSSDASTLQDRDVYLAAQFIREHGTEPVRVDTVAKAVQVSRRKLEQDFKRVTGTTLHEAILQVRVEKAKLLLVQTAWPLALIARRSGLGTRKTLHAVFRKFEQMMPSEYRTRYGGRSEG